MNEIVASVGIPNALYLAEHGKLPLSPHLGTSSRKAGPLHRPGGAFLSEGQNVEEVQMSDLEWKSIPDAIKELDISETELYRLALSGKIKLSLFLMTKTRAYQVEKIGNEYVEVAKNGSREISVYDSHDIEGVFEILPIGDGKICFESKLIDKTPVFTGIGYGTIVTSDGKFYKLLALSDDSFPAYVIRRGFSSDSMIVIRRDSLAALKQSDQTVPEKIAELQQSLRIAAEAYVKLNKGKLSDGEIAFNLREKYNLKGQNAYKLIWNDQEVTDKNGKKIEDEEKKQARMRFILFDAIRKFNKQRP